MSKKFLFSFLLIGSIFLLSSCSLPQDKSGLKSQGLLDESSFLIKLRQFDDAKEKIETALTEIEAALEKDPKNINLKLLRSRALFSLFISQNVIVIENGEVQPKSLVRMPKPFEFINYSTTCAIAEKELKEILNDKVELSYEQEAFIHGTLAAIYRLNVKTVKQASDEYSYAISAYRNKAQEIEKPGSRGNKFKIDLLEVKEQIKSLQISQVEVNLIDNNWKTALDLLEEHLANNDLDYFPIQIELLEDEIAKIRNKIIEQKVRDQASRGGKLTEALEHQRVFKLTPIEEFIGTDALTFDLNQRKERLNALKNNLIYRIICYQHLNQQNNLRNSQHILATYYPELSKELNQLLNQ